MEEKKMPRQVITDWGFYAKTIFMTKDGEYLVIYPDEHGLADMDGDDSRRDGGYYIKSIKKEGNILYPDTQGLIDIQFPTHSQTDYGTYCKKVNTAARGVDEANDQGVIDLRGESR
jgi:hypothetical protein